MPSPEYIRSHSPEGARNRLIAENLRYLEEKRLKLEDLREVYSEEEVRRDAASVRERENRFAHSREGETGKMAEALFHKNVNSGARIFGERAKATLLSLYDDYGLFNTANREERGAWSDVVVEFFPRTSTGREQNRNPYRFVAGIDVTTNIAPKALDVKTLGMKTALDTGQLATVKYFKSEESSFNYRYAGALHKIPKAVIAMDSDSTWQLAELTDRAETGEGKAEDMIRTSPLARVALAELLIQFDAFREYAKRVVRDTEAERKFSEGVARVAEIVKEKGLTLQQLSDRVIVANPALKELAKALLRNSFRVRSPTDIA